MMGSAAGHAHDRSRVQPRRALTTTARTRATGLLFVVSGGLIAAAAVLAGFNPSPGCPAGGQGWACGLRHDVLVPFTLVAAGILAGHLGSILALDALPEVRARRAAGERLRLGRPIVPAPVLASAEGMLLSAASWGHIGGRTAEQHRADRHVARELWAGASQTRLIPTAGAAAMVQTPMARAGIPLACVDCLELVDAIHADSGCPHCGGELRRPGRITRGSSPARAQRAAREAVRA